MVHAEQEQAQQRSTCPRRAVSVVNENILIQAKQEYLHSLLNLDGYQKRLRSFVYQYIKVFDTTDTMILIMTLRKMRYSIVLY